MNVEEERAAVFAALGRAWDALSFPSGSLAGKMTQIEFIRANNTPETIALLEKHGALPRLDSSDATD